MVNGEVLLLGNGVNFVPFQQRCDKALSGDRMVQKMTIDSAPMQEAQLDIGQTVEEVSDRSADMDLKCNSEHQVTSNTSMPACEEQVTSLQNKVCGETESNNQHLAGRMVCWLVN